MRFYSSKGLRASNDWEYGVIIGALQARIGRFQVALWWNLRPIINRYWAPGSTWPFNTSRAARKAAGR